MGRLEEIYNFSTLKTQGEAIILGCIRLREITTAEISETSLTVFPYISKSSVSSRCPSRPWLQACVYEVYPYQVSFIYLLHMVIVSNYELTQGLSLVFSWTITCSAQQTLIAAGASGCAANTNKEPFNFRTVTPRLQWHRGESHTGCRTVLASQIMVRGIPEAPDRFWPHSGSRTKTLLKQVLKQRSHKLPQALLCGKREIVL